MGSRNRGRHAGDGTAHSQEAQAGPGGRKRPTVKAAVHDEDITAPERVEEALRIRTHDLGERVKELNCLYGISNLAQRPGVSLEEVLQGTAELVPPGWQYPEITCARITVDAQEFRTENFRETAWRQSNDIMVSGEGIGSVEVCYLEEKPGSHEGPFLKEERSLINAIAERLGQVVEKWRAEEALRESEERFRSLVMSSRDGILAYDKDCRFTIWNPAMERASRLRSEDVLGRAAFEVFPFLDEVGEADAFRDAISGRPTTRTGIPYGVPQTGRSGYFESSHVPLLDAHGTIAGEMAIIRDITERKQAEEALRESEAKYHSLFEQANDSIFISDPSTRRFLDVNENAARRLGYTREELLRLAVNDIDAAGDSARIEANIRQLLDAGSIVIEHTQRRKDGTEMPVEITSRLIEYGGRQVIQSFVRDITERKRAEAALRAANRLLEKTLASLDDALLVVDPSTRTIVTCNAAAERIFGYAVDDIVGRDTEFLHVDRRMYARFGQALFPALDAHGVYRTEFEMRRKDGSVFPSEHSVTEIVNDSGERTGVVSVVRDISERKQAEEALRQSEERFRTSVENMLDCFGIYSAIRDESGCIVDFRVKYVNAMACANNRMTKEEQIGKRLLELLPAHRETGLFDEYCQVVETSRPLEKESLVYEDAYGSRRLARAFDIRAAKLGDGFAAAWRDITERKWAEEALRESEERYRSIFDTAANLITSVNTEGIIVDCNDRIQPVLGYRSDEIIGQGMAKIIHPDYLARAQDSLNEILTEGYSFNKEYKMVRKDGTLIDVSINSSALTNEAGDYQRTICIIDDITKRKQAEEELRRLSELKSDFIALVSHELRSPLTSLSGGLELIAQDAPSLPPRDQRALAILSRECARLNALVESLLDVTRLDAGQLPLTFGPVWLAPLIAGAAVSVAGAGSHQYIDVRVPRGLPPAWADEVYLEQVMRNLLGNAVKYSAWDQPIVVEARAQGDSLMISVTDRGPGIAKAEQQHIFDAFYRAVGAVESSAGYGLGLYFARKLIEAQGGTIEVTSPVFDDPAASGTTFTVALPIAHDEA